MRTSRAVRSVSRRTARRKVSTKRASKLAGKGVIRAVRPAPPAPVQVQYRMCKSPWSVIVEKTPNALGTRFVCPFCPLSHRVPGPVRGFRKVSRDRWIKFRRVAE
jgi:hypothetical protein